MRHGVPLGCRLFKGCHTLLVPDVCPALALELWCKPHSCHCKPFLINCSHKNQTPPPSLTLSWSHHTQPPWSWPKSISLQEQTDVCIQAHTQGLRYPGTGYIHLHRKEAVGLEMAWQGETAARPCHRHLEQNHCRCDSSDTPRNPGQFSTPVCMSFLQPPRMVLCQAGDRSELEQGAAERPWCL